MYARGQIIRKSISINSNKTDCQFLLILKKYEDGLYRMVSAKFEHNHPCESQLYIHHRLTSLQKELIISMKNAGLRNTMIAKILGILYSEEYGLLTRQIKSIYKRPSRLVNEITELKEYCNENQIFISFFPEESNPLAIFIVTQNELENGTKYGDFSVIGSTHGPNIFQFGI